MRALGIAASTCFLLFASEAGAQQKPGPNSQFSLRREAPGGADADIARSRARGGDCAGALHSYDAAISKTIEPTLRRDRGICHDRLGNPFPAIEDYRAYLTARPDAPDAEQIRARLVALEASVSGESQKVVADEDNPEIGGDTNAKATAAVEIKENEKGSKKKDGRSRGSEDSIKTKSYEENAEQEKLAESSDASPLRYGQGVVIGAYLYMPRYFFYKGNFGPLSYGVGAALRYSTGPILSVVGELGVSGTGSLGENGSASGPMTFLGLEARIPLTRFAGDHFLVRGGVGFEHITVSGTQAYANLIPIRGALGYRHVFGPSVGLEVLADAGAVDVIAENGDSLFEGVVAGNVAFVVGF